MAKVIEMPIYTSQHMLDKVCRGVEFNAEVIPIDSVRKSVKAKVLMMPMRDTYSRTDLFSPFWL